MRRVSTLARPSLAGALYPDRYQGDRILYEGLERRLPTTHQSGVVGR